MERLIYSIILGYFILGGIGFYLINRKKERDVARKSYTKFGVYFIIINILFFSITVQTVVFSYLAILIVAVGCFELSRLFVSAKFQHKLFFVLSLLVYFTLSAGVLMFSWADNNLILLTFLVLSIFDSFSQISGQLFGQTKIMPGISPNKTWGGVVGGTVISLLSAFLLKNLFRGTNPELFLFAFGTLFFAFAGDILASLYKRKFRVKDYSNWIPGHGGFLDRFDSLIAGGAWAAIAIPILGIKKKKKKYHGKYCSTIICIFNRNWLVTDF
ncbi:phosphatidate cytidylyltransferase [Tangfeifania diversioriginum]|uniref:Phosphatidate cytidylyltransferase n=1 Tax=Tangfeifania diversioriginum TaxID=1168035 RepID=A0A1M6PRX1_9BACT|nr:phosphatidate cytidylyltransferase [Tangfeifania diversioriginum]SHK10618.1 phosphatidate cytidylyltransferase [Tangfeifania diversioriginum]